VALELARIEKNPIYILANDVFEEKLSLGDVKNILNHPSFFGLITEVHCLEMKQLIGIMIKQHPDIAQTFSVLNRTCLKHFANQKEIAKATEYLDDGWRLLRNNQQEKAIESFRCALSLYKRVSSHSGIAGCIFGIAFAYQSVKDYENALFYYKKAKRYFKKSNIQSSVIQCEFELGKIYLIFHDYNKALNSFCQVIKKSQDPTHLWQVYAEMADIQKHYNNLSMAKKSLQKSIEIIENLMSCIDRGDLNDLLERFSKVYHEMISVCVELKDFKCALEYVERLKSRTLMEMIFEKSKSITGDTGDETRFEHHRLLFGVKKLISQCYMKEDVTDRSAYDWGQIIDKYLEKATPKPLHDTDGNQWTS